MSEFKRKEKRMASLMFKFSAKEHTPHGLANLLFRIMMTSN